MKVWFPFSDKIYRLGVIQQLRGPNFTQFWPPPPSNGQLRTFYTIPLSRDQAWTHYWPPPPSSCPRSYWMTTYIVGVILWDAISPHFSLSNSLLKLNSDRLSCVWGATRLHTGLKTIMMNYFCFYSLMISRDIPSILVKSRFSKYQIKLEIYPNICGLLWKPVFE